VVIAAILLGPSSGFALALRPARAEIARVVSATDTANLRYKKTVHKNGRALLLEEGTARGTLPGNMTASLDVEGVFSGTFTLHLHDGTITGSGTAKPHGSGVYESFGGKLTVTGGTGRYRNAHGQAGLYGTFNRHSYALVVQTTGKLTY